MYPSDDSKYLLHYLSPISTEPKLVPSFFFGDGDEPQPLGEFSNTKWVRSDFSFKELPRGKKKAKVTPEPEQGRWGELVRFFFQGRCLA